MLGLLLNPGDGTDHVMNPGDGTGPLTIHEGIHHMISEDVIGLQFVDVHLTTLGDAIGH